VCGRFQWLVPVLALLVSVVGCALVKTGDVRNYETVTASPKRDTVAAKKHNRKAIRALKDDDFLEARSQADRALIANVNYAPAHNTLGRVHYCQKNYYLAAWEFEFAIRLQAEIPEYHNNLGLVFEASDKLPKAIAEYQLAVDLDREDYHYVSNLVRVRIRNDERNPETRRLLEKVVLMDPRKEWKDWAQLLLNTTHLDIPAAEEEFLLLHSTNIVFPPLQLPSELTPEKTSSTTSDDLLDSILEPKPDSGMEENIHEDWPSLDERSARDIPVPTFRVPPSSPLAE